MKNTCNYNMAPAGYPIWEPTVNGSPNGCYKHCGEYWVNTVAGNTESPEEGRTTGTWVGSFEHHCDLIQYIVETSFNGLIEDFQNNHTGHSHGHDHTGHGNHTHTNNGAQGCHSDCDNREHPRNHHAHNHLPATTINALRNLSADVLQFIGGIESYCSNKVYNCDDWVIFEGKLARSKEDNNDQHPHNKKVWEFYGDLKNLLTAAFGNNGKYTPTLEYYVDCKNPGCELPYGKGACVVVMMPDLDDNGIQKTDSCGNPLFIDSIFDSLEDENTDHPVTGSQSNPKTWDGPMAFCELIKKDRLCEWGDSDAPIQPLKPGDLVATCVNGKTVFKRFV